MFETFIKSTPLYVIVPVGVLLACGILYLMQEVVQLAESSIVGNVILGVGAIGMVAFVFHTFFDLGIF